MRRLEWRKACQSGLGYANKGRCNGGLFFHELLSGYMDTAQRFVPSNSSLISTSINDNASAFCGIGRLNVVPGRFFITGWRLLLIKKRGMSILRCKNRRNPYRLVVEHIFRSQLETKQRSASRSEHEDRFGHLDGQVQIPNPRTIVVPSVVASRVLS